MFDPKITLGKGIKSFLIVLISIAITSLPVLLPFIANLSILDIVRIIIDKIYPGLATATVVSILIMLLNWLKNK